MEKNMNNTKHKVFLFTVTILLPLTFSEHGAKAAVIDMSAQVRLDVELKQLSGPDLGKDLSYSEAVTAKQRLDRDPLSGDQTLAFSRSFQDKPSSVAGLGLETERIENNTGSTIQFSIFERYTFDAFFFMDISKIVLPSFTSSWDFPAIDLVVSWLPLLIRADGTVGDPVRRYGYYKNFSLDRNWNFQDRKSEVLSDFVLTLYPGDRFNLDVEISLDTLIERNLEYINPVRPATPIPIPSSLVAILSGVLALLYVRRPSFAS
jgi:hypothetical protein